MKRLFLLVGIVAMLMPSCKSLTGTQKGAGIGVAGGAAAGAIIGRASGNTAAGAIIGATVGGVTGAVIGNQMDKQAEEMKKKVPEAKVERVGEGIVVEMSSNILFGFDSSDLSSEAKKNLDKMVVVFKEYKDTDIEVQGHTDSSGAESYNQKLSERRASTVANYVIGRGIPASRLKVVGYGKLTPKYSNDNETGRAQNRRVEFVITANQKMIDEAERSAK